jgi:hypothetical protein
MTSKTNEKWPGEDKEKSTEEMSWERKITEGRKLARKQEDRRE